ncbi:FadR/GntR family transcriptional regulator [Parafilimonas sp.]|uniref:FadR/GntR family transcriptional regulator n=1 Tax=Parafilimonas sp. TaxID=1969739 RepID=UPI003F7EE165
MPVKASTKDLEKIAHKTMADIVEIRLREYLKNKSFRPGDALPKETEMAESLGVSRNVVREALSRLRMLGMIETKRKRGMVLTSPDIMGSFERVLDPLFIDENTLQDIFELRLVLEMGLADLLFIRKKKEDIDELEAIAKKQKPTTGQHAFRIKNEIDFHGKLYSMTNNPTLQRFQDMLLPVFGYLVSLEKVPIVGSVSHLDLVNILRNGSKEEFRKAMAKHLEHHFKKIRKK